MATYLAAVYIGDFDRIDHGPLYEGGPLLARLRARRRRA